MINIFKWSLNTPVRGLSVESVESVSSRDSWVHSETLDHDFDSTSE